MTLYNLRTGDNGYRITKFDNDGNVESAYDVTQENCTCPAGSRPTCRHRQMLPDLLDRHMADSGLFWHFDGRFSCDINGIPARHTVEQTVEPALIPLSSNVQMFTLDGNPETLFNAIADAVGEPCLPPAPQPFRRRL